MAKKPPQTVVSNYKRGLKLYEDGKGGKGLEASTVSKARDIAKGGSVSDEWIRKANRWWGRNNRFLKEPSDSPAYVSALLWGGAAGRDWYQSQYKQLEKDEPTNNMQKLIFCQQRVNQDMISREVRDGEEYMIVKSYTLPPNIVMNGGLYSTDEVEAALESGTFDMMPATIEHPAINNEYVSANDPRVDMDYRFGMWNEVAGKTDDGRIILNKVVNVKKLKMFEKGKRLLDRLEDIETNANARPIHTSIGVFCNPIDLPEPVSIYNGIKLNAEATWAATEIVGDHDAFLIDTTGAATPEQGTGIGINSRGKQIDVEHFTLDNIDEANDMTVKTNEGMHGMDMNQMRTMLKDMMSGDMQNRMMDMDDMMKESMDMEKAEMMDVMNGYYTYRDMDGKMYMQDYGMENNMPKMMGQRRMLADNNQDEENAMRKNIIAELEGRGISVNSDISDSDLLAKYNESLKADKGDDATIKANEDLVKTVRAQGDQITKLTAQLQANADKELNDKIAVIKANDAYKAIPESSLKVIAANNLEDFNKMYEDSKQSVSLGSTMPKVNSEAGADDFTMKLVGAE